MATEITLQSPVLIFFESVLCEMLLNNRVLYTWILHPGHVPRSVGELLALEGSKWRVYRATREVLLREGGNDLYGISDFKKNDNYYSKLLWSLESSKHISIK